MMGGRKTAPPAATGKRRLTRKRNWVYRPTRDSETFARARACTPGRTETTRQENLRSSRGHSPRPGSRLPNLEGAHTARHRLVNVPRHTQVTNNEHKKKQITDAESELTREEPSREQSTGTYLDDVHAELITQPANKLKRPSRARPMSRTQNKRPPLRRCMNAKHHCLHAPRAVRPFEYYLAHR